MQPIRWHKGGFLGLKKYFSAGRQWAKKNYPIHDSNTKAVTSVGEFIMKNGGKDFDKNMSNLTKAGTVMREWLRNDIPGVQCDRHTHLNERHLDGHTTTVGIIMESQPVVYIWSLPQENHEHIKISLKCNKTIDLTVRENGSIDLPNTEFIKFDKIQQLMDKVKHMGLFLYDENRLKLVTTKPQYESFLEKFSIDKSLTVSGIHQLDENQLFYQNNNQNNNNVSNTLYCIMHHYITAKLSKQLHSYK